jgi:hypothetical protein
LQGRFDLTDDFKTWGIVFLVFMGVSIVARIIVYIIFHILNAIATREQDIPREDERDKFVRLKATRNSHYAFSITMMLDFLLLATGMPVCGLFIIFIIGGLTSEIIDNGSQIYYYRKGL